jgi:hypothetical protein
MKAALSLSKSNQNSNHGTRCQRLAARFATGVLSLLMALTLALPLQMNAQTSQTGGWGSASDYSGTTSNTQNSPYGRYYGWEYKVFCYSPNTLDFSGVITEIAFLPATTQSTAGTNTSSSFTANGLTDSNPLQIWMKEVDADFTLNSSTDFATYVSDATKVYSGNIPATTSGTMTSFTLSTSFTHSQENCLLILVRTVANGTTGDGSVNAYYKALSNGGNLVWYQRDDNSDPGINTTADGVVTNNLPVLQVTYTVSTTPRVSLSPTSATILTGSTQTLTATRHNVTGTPTITYSSSNTNVATVSGSGTTATVTGVSAGTATITATMTYGGNTYTAQSTITVEDPSYCTPNPTSVDGNGITTLTFADVSNSNSSGLPSSSPFYADYTSMVGNVNAGDQVDISIEYSTGSSTVYSYGTIIWVDWNKNYEFEDSEIVYTGTSTQGSGGTPQYLTATFTIPDNQTGGDYRMRIAGADSYFDDYISGYAEGEHDPCFTSYYAVCHDYTLRVTPSTCDISITLTDAYGDGGGEVQVLNANTNEELASYTLGDEEASHTYTLNVANGAPLSFVYTSTDSWPYENGFVITAPNGEIIAQHDGCRSSGSCDAPNNGVITTYTVNCSEEASSCPTPTDLDEDNITTNSATLSWNGNNDSYVLQYRPWFQVGEDKQATGEFVTYTYDLSEFSGMGSIAIRHYDVTDMFYLNVDDVLLTDASANTLFSEDFESGSIPSTWTNYDVDGDGYVWDLASSSNMTVNGNYGVYSASWISSEGALTPDNWLIISNVEMGGTFSFAAVGQDPNYPAENFAVYVSLESSITEVPVAGTTYNAENLEPGTPYAWQVKGVCGENESNWVSSLFKTKDDVLVFANDGNWNVLANWTDGEGNAIAALPTRNNKVRIDADAIVPAGYIAEAGKATINGGSITIKDGGQLKHNAATLWVTMEKEISAYTSENNNYYFISTPFSGATTIGENTGWSHVLNLTSGDYDLYAFDATAELEWINHEADSYHSEFTAGNNNGIVFKKGYLYANAADNTLQYNGTISKTIDNSMTEEFSYDGTSEDDFNGWRLVGNPFACNA